MLSVRQIGEGHRSTIGFRSVVIGPTGDVALAPRRGGTSAGTVEDAVIDAELFDELAGEDDAASCGWVLDTLPPTFDVDALAARLRRLEAQTDNEPRRRRDVVADDGAGQPVLRHPLPGDVVDRRADPHAGLRGRVARPRGSPASCVSPIPTGA